VVSAPMLASESPCGTSSEKQSNRFVRGSVLDANVMFCAFFHSPDKNSPPPPSWAVCSIFSFIKRARSGAKGRSHRSDPLLVVWEHAPGDSASVASTVEAAEKAVSLSYAKLWPDSYRAMVHLRQTTDARPSSEVLTWASARVRRLTSGWSHHMEWPLKIDSGSRRKLGIT